ncbi:MAG: diphthine--ammonia ligase [Candidatus Auribacterota bacterium]
MKEKIVFCWSGGKDSALALHDILINDTYEVVSLLTTITEPYDRISMHGVRRELLDRQAESLGLPLHVIGIPDPCSNEIYEQRMAQALEELKKTGFIAVAFGDIFLEDLKQYRIDKLKQVGLKAVFPLWKRDTTELLSFFVTQGFRAVLSCIDTSKLDASFVGRNIDASFAKALPESVDPCGENGEFHSFVYDGPIFSTPIQVTTGEHRQKDRFLFCDVLPAVAVKVGA